MPESTTGLQLSGVSASYGRNRVLDKIDLHVAPGEIVGLVGRNGAGKTTLLSCISATVKATEGTRSFAGKSLPNRPSRVAKAGIAHVPEGRGMIKSFSVRDNLRIAAMGAGRRSVDEAAFNQVFEIFPKLSQIVDRPAGVLSGGEQQMVALARGMLVEPTLMLVDEMSLGLAPVMIQTCWDALLELRSRRNVSILIVDQNVDLIRKHCNRTYVLEHREVREWEPAAATDERSDGIVYFS